MASCPSVLRVIASHRQETGFGVLRASEKSRRMRVAGVSVRVFVVAFARVYILFVIVVVVVVVVKVVCSGVRHVLRSGALQRRGRLSIFSFSLFIIVVFVRRTLLFFYFEIFSIRLLRAFVFNSHTKAHPSFAALMPIASSANRSFLVVFEVISPRFLFHCERIHLGLVNPSTRLLFLMPHRSGFEHQTPLRTPSLTRRNRSASLALESSITQSTPIQSFAPLVDLLSFLSFIGFGTGTAPLDSSSRSLDSPSRLRTCSPDTTSLPSPPARIRRS